MLNGPIIRSTLDGIDNAITTKSGTFRAPSASIGDYRDKINNLIRCNFSGLGYTLTFLLLISVGSFKQKEKENQQNNPTTVEFKESPLNGFDI